MVRAELLGLWFRAGGGHNFGGGSHSSGSRGFSSGNSGFSSGGSGSSSGGSAIVGVIFLVIIVVIVLVVISALRKKTRGPAGAFAAAAAAGAMVRPPTVPGGQVPVAPPAAAPVDGVQAGIAAIRQHDPGFDEARFVSDAERAFFTVQQAWTELKPDMSRRVMADNIWQQHRVQIDSYTSNHKRNVLENLAIANATIVGAHTDGAYDTIMLRFRAGCSDYDVDTTNNKIVRGSRDFTQWTEDWCFQRSAKATTKTEGGTMASRCPNCGAPLDIDLAGICKYCRAPVMSGQYDWVLTRIEQINA